MPMQATMIRASMTAYSTAVGPSSLVRNCRARDVKAFIGSPLLLSGRLHLALGPLRGPAGRLPSRRGFQVSITRPQPRLIGTLGYGLQARQIGIAVISSRTYGFMAWRFPRSIPGNIPPR